MLFLFFLFMNLIRHPSKRPPHPHHPRHRLRIIQDHHQIHLPHSHHPSFLCLFFSIHPAS